jgi:hypothetical protein
LKDRLTPELPHAPTKITTTCIRYTKRTKRKREKTGMSDRLFDHYSMTRTREDFGLN